MCNFSIPFTGNSENLVRRAQNEIEKAGGAFDGNASQGSFQVKTPLGSIHGAYQVAGQEIALTIMKKPLLLSCSRIEQELTNVMR